MLGCCRLWLRELGGKGAEEVRSVPWLKVVAALLGVTTEDAVCVITESEGTSLSPPPGNRDAVSAETAEHDRGGGIAERGRGWGVGEATCTANIGM